MKKITLSLLLFCVSAFVQHVSAQAEASFDKILSAYYDIKNALVNDDGKTAASKAAGLEEALGQPPAGQLTAAQQSAWKEHGSAARATAQSISQTTDVEKQRGHLAGLSEHLLTMAKAVGMNQSDIYQQYCPMKKAYWLSETQAVKNPYYGKKMLACGKTTATLPANK
mgnify:FL=1